MALNLNNVSLKITAGTVRQFPRSATPQIALAGRSNVGKSSLINTLLGRRALARVSSAPGKTITVNFYDVDGKLFLVDLPGYGYAKRPPEDKARWSELTDGYFTNNPSRDRTTRSRRVMPTRIWFWSNSPTLLMRRLPRWSISSVRPMPWLMPRR